MNDYRDYPVIPDQDQLKKIIKALCASREFINSIKSWNDEKVKPTTIEALIRWLDPDKTLFNIKETLQFLSGCTLNIKPLKYRLLDPDDY